MGHIFKLQQGYARSMGCTFTDASGTEQVPFMGCFGIGTTRLVQAIVDQNHDDKGITWPWELAPYHVVVVPVSWKNESQRRAAEQIYQALKDAGVRTLLDDRNLRMGEKLTDAELLGCPFRVVVGRRAAEGLFEVRKRGAPNDDPSNAEVSLEDMLTAWGHGGRDAWKGFVKHE